MSKHLPKTSMHLEDDDVKIWGKDEEEDGDVKIWRRPFGGDAAPTVRHEELSDSAQDEAEDETDSPELYRRGARHGRELTRRRLIQVAAAGALLALAMVVPAEGLLRAGCFLVPLLAVGFDLLLDAIEEAMDGDVLNESLMVCLAAILAFVLGAYFESVLIVLLMRIQRLFRDYALEKSETSLNRLERLRSASANVETAEGLLSVSPDYVDTGDIIVVDPGERFALDGVVVEGITDVDTGDLTGEEEPRSVSEGGRVFSGTVNLTRTVRVRVTSGYRDSTASRVLRFTRGSAVKDFRLRRFTGTLGRIFMPAAALAAAALAIVPAISDGLWAEWSRRAVILLALSGAGTLSAAVSLAYAGALGRAARSGILSSSPDCLDTLAKTDTMVFGKTGTITEGHPVITDIFPVGVSEAELLTLAAIAESRSTHPLARMLRAACDTPPEAAEKLTNVREIPGKGVIADVGGRRIYVGNAALLAENGIRYAVPGRSGAAIHVALDGRYRGHILVADKIREGAYESMEGLRLLGVKKLVMLTGDVLSVARPIASKLNFDMLRSELMPEDKADAVDYLIKNRGERSSIVFVGDGLSDMAVLKKADLGVAMGALDYGGAMDSADMLIMGEDIRTLPLAVTVAQRACSIARLNTAALLAEKLILMALGAMGLLPIGIAVGVDAGLSMAALLNSLRCMKIEQVEK